MKITSILIKTDLKSKHVNSLRIHEDLCFNQL
jgi:hypothetical protein